VRPSRIVIIPDKVFTATLFNKNGSKYLVSISCDKKRGDKMEKSIVNSFFFIQSSFVDLKNMDRTKYKRYFIVLKLIWQWQLIFYELKGLCK